MRLILLIIFLLVVNCKFDKVVDSHGIHYLDKKNKQLVVKSSNKNDIMKLLGPPSTKSKFDNDVWIYIERKKTNKGFFTLGSKVTYVNNVLMLEIDYKGLLAKKEFFNMSDINKIKFSESETDSVYSKRSFVYDFLSSMRQKINDPLGVRAKKRKEIKSQQ